MPRGRPKNKGQAKEPVRVAREKIKLQCGMCGHKANKHSNRHVQTSKRSKSAQQSDSSLSSISSSEPEIPQLVARQSKMKAIARMSPIPKKYVDDCQSVSASSIKSCFKTSKNQDKRDLKVQFTEPDKHSSSASDSEMMSFQSMESNSEEQLQHLSLKEEEKKKAQNLSIDDLLNQQEIALSDSSKQHPKESVFQEEYSPNIQYQEENFIELEEPSLLQNQELIQEADHQMAQPADLKLEVQKEVEMKAEQVPAKIEHDIQEEGRQENNDANLAQFQQLLYEDAKLQKGKNENSPKEPKIMTDSAHQKQSSNSLQDQVISLMDQIGALSHAIKNCGQKFKFMHYNTSSNELVMSRETINFDPQISSSFQNKNKEVDMVDQEQNDFMKNIDQTMRLPDCYQVLFNQKIATKMNSFEPNILLFLIKILARPIQDDEISASFNGPDMRRFGCWVKYYTHFNILAQKEVELVLFLSNFFNLKQLEQTKCNKIPQNNWVGMTPKNVIVLNLEVGEGKTLRTFIKRHQPFELQQVFELIKTQLHSIHGSDNMFQGGINPDNIIVNLDLKKVVFLDWALSCSKETFFGRLKIQTPYYNTHMTSKNFYDLQADDMKALLLIINDCMVALKGNTKSPYFRMAYQTFESRSITSGYFAQKDQRISTSPHASQQKSKISLCEDTYMRVSLELGTEIKKLGQF